MQRSHLGRFSADWFSAPPLEGGLAVACSLAAVAIPALMRLAMFPGVNDYQCITFCPFVLATAIVAGSRLATIVAIANAAICNALMGAHYVLHLNGPSLVGSFIFLSYSFIVIGCVHLVRKRSARSPAGEAASVEPSGGIVFSLEAGEAWASWQGSHTPVRLGAEHEVASMMEDFLAQLELGKRLENRRAHRA